MNPGIILGAWLLYTLLGGLVARVPGWPAKGSLRYISAFAIPAVAGIITSLDRGYPAYMIAGFVAAATIYALVDKRARDTT